MSNNLSDLLPGDCAEIPSTDEPMFAPGETSEIRPLSVEEINKIALDLSPVPKTERRNYGPKDKVSIPPSDEGLRKQKKPYVRQKLIPKGELDLSEDVPTITDTSDTSDDSIAYE